MWPVEWLIALHLPCFDLLERRTVSGNRFVASIEAKRQPAGDDCKHLPFQHRIRPFFPTGRVLPKGAQELSAASAEWDFRGVETFRRRVDPRKDQAREGAIGDGLRHETLTIPKAASSDTERFVTTLPIEGRAFDV